MPFIRETTGGVPLISDIPPFFLCFLAGSWSVAIAYQLKSIYFCPGFDAKDARHRAGSLPANPFFTHRVRVDLC